VTDEVGVALLGAAHTTHAWAYARALTEHPRARLVGVHDHEPEHARWVCQDFGVPFHDSAERLVRSAAVDAVVVCTETVRHRAAVELAAAAGRHVLCEKPLATTLQDAEAAVAVCADAGVQLHLAFVSRFLPVVARAREAVRAGRLGDVRGMVGGNRGRPPLPPGYPPWITDRREAGGGAVIDHSVHVTDVMRHVSGLEVTTVSAEAGALLWGCGVEDVGVLLLRFGNGAVGSVDPSWSVPEGNPWDHDFFLRVVGTQGSIDLTDAAASLEVVGGGTGLRLESFAEDADAAMLDAFVASVREGAVAEPCATGEDGLEALRVALAAYESASSGRPVPLSVPS
jgi:predicted dehydrogenase